MTKRKTDGERLADRLFGLALDDQEPKWLATEIDRLIRRRMAEAWEDGWFDRDCQEADWNENPYREEKEMSDTIEAIRKRHATTTLRAYGSHAAFQAQDDRATLLAEVGRMSDEIVVLRRSIDRMTRERDEERVGIKRMREALIEWDGLIKHQYSGTREAMSDMQIAALHTKQILDDLEAKP